MRNIIFSPQTYNLPLALTRKAVMRLLPDVFVMIKVHRFDQLQQGNVVFNDSPGPLLLVTVVGGVTKVFHQRGELKSFPVVQIVFTCRYKTGNHRKVSLI